MSSDESVVGKLGVVTHPIAGDKAGEILVRIRGGTETYMAYAEEDLPVKARVVVIGQRSPRTVDVAPFDE